MLHRRSFTSLLTDDGVPLFRLFIVAEEVLQSHKFKPLIAQMQRFLSKTQKEQQKKIMNFFGRKEQMLLC